ncbi:tetratricopeptide repeat protein [bacterium]|nr:tetratricopeptide repeat protein [bacterium]
MNTRRPNFPSCRDCFSLRSRNRAGWVKIAIACGVLLTVAAVAAIWLGVREAQRAAAFEKLADQARPLLQQGRNDEALDVLTSLDGSVAPPENRYLKAIALDRLQRYEAANAEITQAIEQSPKTARYKALELKLRLFARDRDSIDQLIEMNRDFASVGAVALFATYGFQAKAVLLDIENKPEAAAYHRKRKTQTLATALTLSSEMPELYPELLQFARREGRNEEALSLLNELLKLNPQDLKLRDDKVKVLIALKQIDDAVELAGVLYDETGGTKTGAEYFAAIVAQASDAPEHRQKLRRLTELYPQSTQIISHLAVYLTRTGHLAEAQTKLAEAIGKRADTEDRETLVFAAITLPLEVNSPDLAEETLRKYRSYLKDPLLVDYFEARILYLRKRHSDAVRRMLQIVEAAKKNGGGSQRLATEALTWVRTILTDKVLAEQMELAIATSKKSADAPRIEVRVAEEPPQQDAEKPGAAPPAESPETELPVDSKPASTAATPAGNLPSPAAVTSPLTVAPQ